jgi:hypothetical protein
MPLQISKSGIYRRCEEKLVGGDANKGKTAAMNIYTKIKTPTANFTSLAFSNFSALKLDENREGKICRRRYEKTKLAFKTLAKR